MGLFIRGDVVANRVGRALMRRDAVPGADAAFSTTERAAWGLFIPSDVVANRVGRALVTRDASCGAWVVANRVGRALVTRHAAPGALSENDSAQVLPCRMDHRPMAAVRSSRVVLPHRMGADASLPTTERAAWGFIPRDVVAN